MTKGVVFRASLLAQKSHIGRCKKSRKESFGIRMSDKYKNSTIISALGGYLVARIRTIKPEFPQSESMGRISREARLLFIQLWTVADDFGRLRGNSRMLASLLYPYDDDAPSLIDGWIDELVTQDCVSVYEVEKNTYLQVKKWEQHQRVDKPTVSRLPEYSREFAKPRESSPRTLDLGPRILDLGPGPRILDLGPRTVDHLAKSAAPLRPRKNGTELKTAEIWQRYSMAYQQRYRTDPVRNAKVNGQLSNIVSRIGAEEAPLIAEWFLQHNDRWYVQKGHSVECLQKDCEKIRTEWATGNRMTATQAGQLDRTQATGDVFTKLIAEAEESRNAN